MPSHRFDGGLRVALAERLGNGTMLNNRKIAPTWLWNRQVAPTVRLRFRDVYSTPKHGKTIDLRDRSVKLVVQPDSLGIALAIDRGLIRPDGGATT